MRSFEKWMDDTDVEQGANVVASHTLAQRLKAVRYFLKKTVENASGNPEYVHQLRVWARRAVAAIELYRDFVPERRRRRFLKLLKKIRRDAGKARDLDVMQMANLKSQRCEGTKSTWIKNEIHRRRQKAQRPINAIWKRFRTQDVFFDRMVAATHGIREGDPKFLTYNAWSRKQLRQSIEKFFESAHLTDSGKVAQLHKLRVRGKKLKYAMELTACAFGPGFRDELYPAVEEVLKRIGNINDAQVAARRFRKWAANSNSRKRAKRLKRMAAQTRRMLKVSVQEFSSYWTADFIVELRAGFSCQLALGSQLTGKDIILQSQ